MRVFFSFSLSHFLDVYCVTLSWLIHKNQLIRKFQSATQKVNAMCVHCSCVQYNNNTR